MAYYSSPDSAVSFTISLFLEGKGIIAFVYVYNETLSAYYQGTITYEDTEAIISWDQVPQAYMGDEVRVGITLRNEGGTADTLWTTFSSSPVMTPLEPKTWEGVVDVGVAGQLTIEWTGMIITGDTSVTIEAGHVVG